MAARCAILILLAAARGLFWVLEQPKGSLFQYHPLIQHVLSLIKVSRKHIRMGDYGAPSQKPTWLYTGPMSGPIPTGLVWGNQKHSGFVLWKSFDLRVSNHRICGGRVLGCAGLQKY